MPMFLSFRHDHQSRGQPVQPMYYMMISIHFTRQYEYQTIVTVLLKGYELTVNFETRLNFRNFRPE